MKKNLLLSTAIMTSMAVSAQNLKVASVETLDFNNVNRIGVNVSSASKSSAAAAVVQDTLSYFFNKHYYRNSSTGNANLSFITLKNAAVLTGSNQIAGIGGIFRNSGTILVTGGEVLLSRQSNATSTAVPIGIMLYNAPSGTITGAPIASVSAVLTGTAPTFISANFAQPAIVNGTFALVTQNISTVAQDTIRLWVNSALTATSTGTLSAARRHGESLGVVGVGTVANTFFSTTGAFASGSANDVTDYEGIVAPFVTYSITTTAVVPSQTICPNVSITFTNQSSPWIGNRQFNLNQYFSVGGPFSFTGTPAPQPVYSWNFGDGSTTFTTTGNLLQLPKTYTASGTFNGTLTANIRKMADNNTFVMDMGNFTKAVSSCVGLKSNAPNSNVIIYPNPANNGKTSISGLEGDNIITIYNVLGQSIIFEKISSEVYTIDLSNQVKGTYLIRVTNSNSSSRTFKVVNN